MNRRTFLVTLPSVAAPLAAAGCLSSSGTAAPEAPPWRSHRGGIGNTAAVETTGPTATPRVVWWSDSWGGRGIPVVDDGLAVTGAGLADDAVVAVDLETGEEAWRTSVDRLIETALATDGEHIYAGGQRMQALDPDDGEPVWDALVQARGGIAVGEDTLVVGARRRTPLRGLDTATGDERWAEEVFTNTTPAIADGRAVVSSHDQAVSLDLDDGSELWSTELSSRTIGPPSVDGDVVLVATQRDLFALDAADGEQQWHTEATFRTLAMAVSDDRIVATAIHDGTRGLWCLDRGDGTEEWSIEASGLAGPSVAIADGTVFVAGTDSHLHAVDLASGSVEWSLELDWPPTALAVADDRLLAAAAGRLYAVDGDESVAPGPEQWAGLVDPDGPPGAVDGPTADAVEFPFGRMGYDVDVAVDITVDDGAPFSATATIEGDGVDAEDDVVITYHIENDSDVDLRISSGQPGPFDVLTLATESDERRSLTPWSTAYESSGVSWSPIRGVTVVTSDIVGTDVAAGASTAISYHLTDETHRIRPGTFTASQTSTVREAGERSEDGWQVTVDVEVDISSRGTEAGTVINDLEVVETDEPPSSFVGSFDATALTPVTDTHPGLIEVALDTPDDGETAAIASPGVWPFGGYVGHAADGNRVVLLEAESYAPGFVNRIITLESDSSDQQALGGDEAGGWVPTILPHVHRDSHGSRRAFRDGHRSVMQYLVLPHPDNDAPLGGRTYRFEQGYGADGEDVTLGFVLAID